MLLILCRLLPSSPWKEPQQHSRFSCLTPAEPSLWKPVTTFVRLNTRFALPQWIHQLCFCSIIFNLSYTLSNSSIYLISRLHLLSPLPTSCLWFTSCILTDCKLTRATIPQPLRHSPPFPPKNPELGYQGSISRTAPSLLRGLKYTASRCLLSASSKDSTQWSSCKSSTGTVTPEPFRLQWTSSDHLLQHPAPARSAAATCPAPSQLNSGPAETLPPLCITHTSIWPSS